MTRLHLCCRRILKTNPPFPALIGSVTRDLLQKLLCKDPKKRLGSGPSGAQEIKEHPFFRVRTPLGSSLPGLRRARCPGRSLPHLSEPP